MPEQRNGATPDSLALMEDYLLRQSASARGMAHFVNSMLALIGAAKQERDELEAALRELYDALSLGQVIAGTHDNRFTAATARARKALGS